MYIYIHGGGGGMRGENRVLPSLLTRPFPLRVDLLPLDPLGFACSQHRPTPRPSVERICRKAQFSDL